MLCPICKKPVAEEEPDRPSAFPFCSDRCRIIDLGRWLGGKYQIPVRDPDEQPDSAIPASIPRDDQTNL